MPDTYADLKAENDALKAENEAYKAHYGPLPAPPPAPVEFPKWLYKYDIVDGKPVRTDAVVVQNQAEQDALGPGWVDHYDDGSGKPKDDDKPKPKK